MKIAYLVANSEHPHCYGTDFLLCGFYNLLGFDNVFDWPEKDCVHLPSMDARDDCMIDSDQCWPRKNHTLADAIDRSDLAILTAADVELIAVCRKIPRRVPIIAVDFGDRLGDFRAQYELIAGRRLAAYFKRELPVGETWALALPLSYPTSRVPKPMLAKALRFCYYATTHNGGAPGVPRRAIMRQIFDKCGTWNADVSVNGSQFRVLGDQLDVVMTTGQAKGTRPSPEKYHERLAQSLIGLSWNGARNWDCNRFWENFAFGVAQVAERPRIEIPNAPIDGEHCLYADTTNDAVTLLLELLRDEPRARRIAEAGYRHFLDYHSSERRAGYVLRLAKQQWNI